MFSQDLHTHSRWDDGKSPIADMADCAVHAGLTSLGVCVHTPMPFGTQACPQEKLKDFLRDVRAVRNQYALKTGDDPVTLMSHAMRERLNDMRHENAFRAYEEGSLSLKELNLEMDRYAAACRELTGEKGLRIYAGAEWDVLSTIPWDPQEDGTVSLASFDYVIGSVHFITVDNPEAASLAGLPPELASGFRYRHFPVDESHQYTKHMVLGHFQGDAGEALRRYYAQYKKIAENPYVNIVGHFDLPMKFCAMYGFLDREYHVFSEDSPAFREAADEAMAHLVKAGKIFEINTRTFLGADPGASAYRTWAWLSRLHEMGGKVTIASDAHHALDVGHRSFRAAAKLLKDRGFEEVFMLEDVRENARIVPSFVSKPLDTLID